MLETPADPSDEPLNATAVEGGYLVTCGQFSATLTLAALTESVRRLGDVAMAASAPSNQTTPSGMTGEAEVDPPLSLPEA